jgi:hypothetical protein
VAGSWRSTARAAADGRFVLRVALQHPELLPEER